MKPRESRQADVVKMMARSLTVADVLALPVLAAGLPQVLCGHSQLARPIRWVHITELTDPASFLKGGELVLTTGMPLPEEHSQVRRYVDELADIHAAGLVIELVRRYHKPPEALVHACRARDLPLVVLSRDVNFVEVTQVVHSLILGNQMEMTRRAQYIHDAFTALTLRGAGPEEVVRAAAEMSGHDVVLENLVHQAVICEPFNHTVEAILTSWEQRSRATPFPGQSDVHGPESWLVASVEYRGERWGRLVMLPGTAVEQVFGPEHVTVLERTATALTIARLTDSTQWERKAHRNALLELVEQRYRSVGEAQARAEALGLPTKDRRLISMLVTLAPGGQDHARLEDRLTRDLTEVGIPALVGELDAARIGVLLSLNLSRPWRPLVEQLSRSVRTSHPDAIISVGSEVSDISHTASSFQQASRVADATVPDTADKPFHELSDIGLRQLLYSLRTDLRVQDYVERQLGRLVDYDSRHGTELVATLHHYLDAGGNKTVAARRGNLSRQTFYQRLRTIERLLSCNLESGAQRTQLHVALTALDVLRLPNQTGQA
jgi:purine catabolism regulator